MMSALNCSDACANDTRCMSWTWNPSKACYLKDAVAPAMQCNLPIPGQISGCSRSLEPPLPSGCMCDGSNSGKYYARAYTPASGLRSALPLGPPGATVELRADGTLADWRGIFNNGPEGGDVRSPVPAKKVYIEDACFAVWTKSLHNNVTRRATLRTHPPRSLLDEDKGVAATNYSGSFPVARLRILDSSLAVDQLELRGTSSFFSDATGMLRNTATTSVRFELTARNPSSSAVQFAAMFNLPDVFNATRFESGPMTVNSTSGGFVAISRPDGELSSVKGGEMVVSGVAHRAKSSSAWSAQVGHSLAANLRAFSRGDGHLSNATGSRPSEGFRHAALGLGPVTLAAGERVLFEFVLSWDFPHHFWNSKDTHNRNNFSCDQGNFAGAANASLRPALTAATWTHKNRALIDAQAVAWHSLCTDNDFPDWLSDALINSVATLYKTSLWTRDGRWRMWESHSDADLQPPHIHW